jgi:hypothetical protein
LSPKGLIPRAAVAYVALRLFAKYSEHLKSVEPNPYEQRPGQASKPRK